MPRPAPGMGRGLQAILSASQADNEQVELRELPIELISANPEQPRRRFDEESLRALADSLVQRGVLQPVLVRPRPGGSYELLAGERRWRAARLAGLQTLPAVVRELEQDMSALELALIENMARADLTPIEEARACAALVEEFGLTREEVARRVGRSRVAVSNLVRLLELPEDALDLLESGRLTEGHGRALLLAEDHGVRRVLARSAAAEGWSVRTTEARARERNRAAVRQGDRIATGDHAEREHVAASVAEALSQALGAEVRVQTMRDGALRAELRFADADEAGAMARRLGAGAPQRSRRRAAISSVR